MSDEATPTSLVSIAHELGHAIDDALQGYSNIDLDNNNYYVEFISSYIELDFIKYMMQREPEETDYLSILYSYYCETADDLTGLVDAISSECQHELNNYNCNYITEDGEKISVNVIHRVKYGLDRLMAILLHNIYKDNPQEFFVKYSEFLKNCETKDTVELLLDYGVPQETIEDVNPNRDEILSLVKKYN